MGVDIDEAKAFIEEADKFRGDYWLPIARLSWAQIKKRTMNGKLFSTSNVYRRKAQYPAWYSIFKIRQPIILSRIGIPIGRDTTQDGQDNIGATAAICVERLAVNLARGFDMFEVMSACRDDCLATNFAQSRAYYERDTIKEKVRERLTVEQNPETQEVTFFDAKGQIVQSDNIMQDDEGYFIETSQIIDVENERIILEPILYSEVYIDPDIRRWARCMRWAVEYRYSNRQFKERFGAEALADVMTSRYNQKSSAAAEKIQDVVVYEYWDKYDKECYYFAKEGTKFIKPLIMPDPEFDDSYQDLNGLYNLDKFFPCPAPLIVNNSTDEFWPIPEYYQVLEIVEDIHTIFSRMVACTKAIRARLLFDNSITGLQEALNEATEGDAFGITNLSQALASSGGSLEGVVQYIPTDKLIESLNNLYIALESRLGALFKLTGTSDLLQGLTSSNTDKTLGERQMEEKWAINQVAELQKKMAEFVRDNYQLMVEMAIKNFKDESLDQYIMPQTLEKHHQQNYAAALEMLKQNSKRFRIELETDSTIAINENYDKQVRMELVNTLTSAIEKVAAVSQQTPALMAIELHALKYLIQGMRQSKLFQGEITESIDNVIKQAEEAAKNAPPPFNAEEVAAQQKAQELQLKQQEIELGIEEVNATNSLKTAEIESRERIEIAKLNLDGQLASIKTQLDQFKIQSDGAATGAELHVQVQKLQADIGLAQAELALKRDELIVELRKIADKKEADQFGAMIDSRVQAYEEQLGQAELAIQQYKVQMDEKEKYMTEARLQAEHELESMKIKIDIMSKMAETQKQEPPVVHVHIPEAPKIKKKTKVKRDEMGNITDFESSDESA